MMNLGNYFLYAAPISEMLDFGLLNYQTKPHWETPAALTTMPTKSHWRRAGEKHSSD
jgi:hypothetical protein